jgi:hypothetical protein
MGKTRISIEATAQSGATRTYTVWATRGPWIFTLDDFNARRRTSALDKPWRYLDDRVEGGDSRVTSGETSSTPTVVDDSSFTNGREGLAIRMAFAYGSIKPSCGVGCSFGQYVTLRTGDTSVTNMTGATHMSFQARASAPMRALVKLETSNVLDLAFYQAPIDLTTQWVRYTIVFANMVQPPWSATPKPLDLTKVRGFHWHISADDNAALTQGIFYLDDVEIQGWRGP